MPGLWTAIGFQRLQAQWQQNTIKLYLPSCYTHHFPKCFTTLMWLELKRKQGKMKRFGAERSRHFQNRNEMRWWANDTVKWAGSKGLRSWSGRGKRRRRQQVTLVSRAVQWRENKYSVKSNPIERGGRKHEEKSYLVYLASACIGLSYRFSQSSAVQIFWPGGPLWADFSFSRHWLPDGKGWGCQSCRRASAHTHGGLSLQPLSQLADGSEEDLQLSVASGRQCFQTGKKKKVGTPDVGGSTA